MSRVNLPRAIGAMKSAMRKGMAEAMGAAAARATRTPVTFMLAVVGVLGEVVFFLVLCPFSFFFWSLRDVVWPAQTTDKR